MRRMCCVGNYTFLTQAEFEGRAVFAKHTVHVCAWSARGLWSDPCMWDRLPEEGSRVIIERGMQMTLDVTPPSLSSLTVRCSLLLLSMFALSYGFLMPAIKNSVFSSQMKQSRQIPCLVINCVFAYRFKGV
jgi:hypothetical protein